MPRVSAPKGVPGRNCDLKNRVHKERMGSACCRAAGIGGIP